VSLSIGDIVLWTGSPERTDQELDFLAESLHQTIRDRRRRQGETNYWSLAEGDTVVFNDSASPKYIIGAKARVVGKKQTKVVVHLLWSVGKFRAGTPITCPPSILEKVES
jgi:hypothetical protein